LRGCEDVVVIGRIASTEKTFTRRQKQRSAFVNAVVTVVIFYEREEKKEKRNPLYCDRKFASRVSPTPTTPTPTTPLSFFHRFLRVSSREQQRTRLQTFSSHRVFFFFRFALLFDFFLLQNVGQRSTKKNKNDRDPKWFSF
jgi:hypothetical protein